MMNDEGEPVAADAVAGATVTLPAKTVTLHLDDAVEAVLADMLKDVDPKHGEVRFIAQQDADGRTSIGVLVGYKVTTGFRVGAYANLEDGKPQAGVEGRWSFAP